MRLTEGQALEKALGRKALRSLNAGSLDAAESDIAQARTLPNPVFGMERQPARGMLIDERQSTYSVSQRFDLGGKRGLRIDAASARFAAARSDVQTRVRGIANETRRRFHEALALQLAEQALDDWDNRLEEIEAIAQKLQKGGEVAGYDRRRVGRERATASSRLKAARADLARSVELLRAVIGVEPETRLELSGDVLPPPMAPLSSYLAGLESRPDLKALEARAQAYRYEEKLAERSRIPDLTLTAGVRQVDRGPLSDSGLVVALSVPLPIFERGEAGSRRAAGEARTTEAERDIALAKAQGDVRGLWNQATQLRAAAQEFRADAVEASRRLAQIGRSAYRGGEIGVLELLDAQRILVEAETRALEMELAARAATLELEVVSPGADR